ncbi:hypothetical protein EZJ19_09185 [Parasulfuritortus cantonensis]|uniref:Glycosyl transferase family 2 n=1 Tax=Parasulfuritortus cantonensis TaxID=2528202 RepID=A0A4R1BCH0_9PROT|nr:hypothetical protein [Parasulfuritortus cantonensis]TCJ14745.1 hypothetical protein EZJ19_09185 [Parasulfuritortus cantonensis]
MRALSKHSLDDISIIVRECGERTADACSALLAEAFEGQTVHRVTGKPFVYTLRQSLELGAALGRQWTLCIDADVLVQSELIEFMTEARELPETTFAVQALVLDKLLPSKRPAGNHLYRTSLIPQALRLLSGEETLRPETEMIQAMRRAGYGFFQSDRVIGLHDYEQNWEDIFAKAYLHAHKHRQLEDSFLPIWRNLAKVDDDYAVAMAAWEIASGEKDVPRVCRDFMAARFADSGVEVPEKVPLAMPSLQGIEELFGKMASTNMELESHYRRLQRSIDASVFPARTRGNWLVRKGRTLLRFLARWLRKLGYGAA